MKKQSREEKEEDAEFQTEQMWIERQSGFSMIELSKKYNLSSISYKSECAQIIYFD